jgi:hypothetical protein
MRRRSLSLVLFAGLVAWGCGAKSRRTVTARCGPDRDLGAVAVEVRRAFCTSYVRCGIYADVETCEGVTVEPAWFVRDGESGCVSYDDVLMQDCIRALEAADCSFTAFELAYLGACLAPFRGTLDAGELCASDAECESGACLDAPCDETCCPNTCAARDSPVGAACRYHGDCEPEAFCDEGGCAPLRRAGDSCWNDGAVTCESPLWCIEGVCEVPPERGDPCFRSAFFFSCDNFVDWCDSMTLDCVPAAALGEPCSEESQPCGPEATCVEGVCRSKPGLGEPCADRRCLGDLSCDEGGYCALPEDGSSERPPVQECPPG